ARCNWPELRVICLPSCSTFGTNICGAHDTLPIAQVAPYEVSEVPCHQRQRGQAMPREPCPHVVGGQHLLQRHRQLVSDFGRDPCRCEHTEPRRKHEFRLTLLRCRGNVRQCPGTLRRRD